MAPVFSHRTNERHGDSVEQDTMSASAKPLKIVGENRLDAGGR